MTMPHARLSVEDGGGGEPPFELAGPLERAWQAAAAAGEALGDAAAAAEVPLWLLRRATIPVIEAEQYIRCAYL